MNYTVRKAIREDLPRIEEIYAYARKFMAENGNPNQWKKVHPPKDSLIENIEEQKLYIVCSISISDPILLTVRLKMAVGVLIQPTVRFIELPEMVPVVFWQPLLHSESS